MPSNRHNSLNNFDSNCRTLSNVILKGTPKRDIHVERRVEATVVAFISTMGMASGQRECLCVCVQIVLLTLWMFRRVRIRVGRPYVADTGYIHTLRCPVSTIFVYRWPDGTRRHQFLCGTYPWMGKSVEQIKYVAPQVFRYVQSYNVAWYVTIYFYAVIKETYII